MKFDMGASTLSTLTKQTSGSNDDLGGLVKELVAAAEPLEGSSTGALVLLLMASRSGLTILLPS